MRTRQLINEAISTEWNKPVKMVEKLHLEVVRSQNTNSTQNERSTWANQKVREKPVVPNDLWKAKNTNCLES